VPSRDAEDRAENTDDSPDEVDETADDEDLEADDEDLEDDDEDLDDVDDDDEDDELDDEDDDEDEDEDAGPSVTYDELDGPLEVAPIELALPAGVGLTLRHYRTGTDSDGDKVEEAVMLATDGTLHLFRSAEGLVSFVKSDAEHDFAALDGWTEYADGLRAEDVVPEEADEYGLDLVVENLRGGHDVWEPDLLIGAGEVARDIAFACGLNDVLTVLSSGSPLDNLDEALRSGGFLARRRLRKIGSEQAALGWRSVIGKISAAVEWHD
jgi:hypothetical protein